MLMKYCSCLLLVFRMDVVIDRGTKPVALFRMMIMTMTMIMTMMLITYGCSDLMDKIR